MQSQSQFESENELIKSLLQIEERIEERKNKSNSLLHGKLDWDYIFLIADEHRIVPILFKRLKELETEKVPENVLTKFQIKFQEIARFNFARTTQLINLVKLLQEHHYPVLSYKGMTLAQLAYNEINLRQFTDIDLLIRKEDFYEIKDLLASIDCKPAWELTKQQENAVLKHYYEYPFFYGETNTLVEVHWDFIESFFAFDFDTESLWQKTIKVPLYGKDIPTLSPTDYLTVLCSHGSKHFWKRFSWICDIDRLVRNTEIDWNLVSKTASKIGSLRMIWLGLYLSKKLLNTRIPVEIESEVLTDKETILLGEKFIENLFEIDKEPVKWTEMAKIHLQMREKLITKLTYSQRLFTTKLVDKLFMPMGRPR